jgi:hypothetical protein
MFHLLKVDNLEIHTRKAYEWSKTPPYSQKWCAANAGWLYAGQFRYGGRHGFGALATPNGELFEGQFNEDKKHGFGVRMLSNKELWLECYDDGECRMSYCPTRHESLTVHVEASLNRLRWSAAKMTLAWSKGVASVSLLDKMTNMPLGSRIMVPDVISLKIGDPITHSFILQYSDRDNAKRTLEVQAGSDSAFRLVFLALRLVLYEYRVSKPFQAPINAEWFQDLSCQDHGKLLGRFVRGSEGLDERFFKKVRESVARAEAEHRKAFYYACLSYVKMTISTSNHMHTVWGAGYDETFAISLDEFTDPDVWLKEFPDAKTLLASPGPVGSPAISSPWKVVGEVIDHDASSDDIVNEALLDRTVVFLRHCDSLIASKIEGIEQKRLTADEANDIGAIKIHDARLVMLEAKRRWASDAVQILEQAAENVHLGLETGFAHLAFCEKEISDVLSHTVDIFSTPKTPCDRSTGAAFTPISQPDLSTPGVNDSLSPDDLNRTSSPSRAKYAVHNMTHSIMMRRSAITTAMLLQSRRQREIVDLEYAEAEKLLKDAKKQLEQSQAAQRAITLEMKQRAEAAEAEAAKLKTMHELSERQAREYISFNEQLLGLYEGFRERMIRLMRTRTVRFSQTSAFKVWCSKSTRRSALVSSSEKVILRWCKMSLTRAFASWQHHASESLRIRSITIRVIRQWKNKLVGGAFDVWNSLVPSRNLGFQVKRRLATEAQLSKTEAELARLLQNHHELLLRSSTLEADLQIFSKRLNVSEGN